MKEQKITVDLRIICAALLAVIIAMIIIWRPWNQSNTQLRTIDVIGEASVEAEPDEFQFTPTYQKRGTDKAALQQELIAKVNDVIAKLKELGVDESDITVSLSSYDYFWQENDEQVTSNSLTITVDNKELSQKVQDYLITTTPDGQVTPYPSFSKEKQDTLESEARLKAIADARQKAETTAEELGLRLGKVVSVDDSQSGIVYPMLGKAEAVSADTSSLSMPVLPGKQDINYTVTVTYEIK